MTEHKTHKTFKRRVRGRMAKTGESCTAARKRWWREQPVEFKSLIEARPPADA
jgi:hypothetical protein